MADHPIQRRLAAVLAADVVGYSRLMGIDEAATRAALNAHLGELIEPAIAARHGRVVKLMGDGVLAEFASVIDAVEAAAEIQRAMPARNADTPPDRHIVFRIGINLGDLIVEGDDIHGTGVNIAARLEGLADPGGICVSHTVYEHAAGAVDLAFDDLGPHTVKNIPHPVHAYRVQLDAPPADSQPAAAPPQPAPPDKPSVAVLPFHNLSADPEQAYFSDGITEEIITALSRVRHFLVIARNSTFAYQGQSPDVRTVARELGVRYVVEGSVRKAANRVRLTAQLVDGATAQHLWAERYDRDLADIFDLQDELTQTIVGAIEPELAKAEQQRARLKRPDTLDTWDLYQRAMADLHKLTRASLADADATLTRVTAAAPDFAAAYAALANVRYYTLVLGFFADHQATRAAALAAGRRAVELDADDADTHCAVGRGYMVNHLYDDAAAELQAAIAINPSHALAHYSLGAAYVFRGQPVPSLPHLDDAIRLSPRDANMGSFLVRKAQAMLYLKDYEAAVDWARRALRLPNFQWSRNVMLISALGHLGRPEEAAAPLAQLLDRIPDFSADYALDSSPWLDDHHFRHMIDGLHKAGLPQPDGTSSTETREPS